MTSTCGGVLPLARRASRCSTPKRCCSSTTTSAEVGERARPPTAARACRRRCRPRRRPPRPARVRRAAAPCEPVSSATRVGDVGGAELAGLRERAEHRAQRAGVLLGEHLGRREQRGLPAAVDDLRASPAARRSSCPSRPRPAAAGTSVRLRPARAASTSPTSRCPAVSAKGSARVEGLEQPAGRARPRACRPARGVAARRWASVDLQDERLVPLQPLARAGDVGAQPVGLVDAAQRLLERRAARAARAGRRAAGRRRGRPCRAPCARCAAIVRLLDLRGRRVDRHQRAGELLGDHARRRRRRAGTPGCVSCTLSLKASTLPEKKARRPAVRSLAPPTAG